MPRLVETKKEQDLQLVQHPESMWVSGGSVAQTARSVPRLLERRKKEARPAANTAALTARMGAHHGSKDGTESSSSRRCPPLSPWKQTVPVEQDGADGVGAWVGGALGWDLEGRCPESLESQFDEALRIIELPTWEDLPAKERVPYNRKASVLYEKTITR
eukprot:1156204-Pelagomonas_calceolata.AAC.4